MGERITVEPLTIHGYSDEVATGEATVVAFDRAGRWGRALRGLAVAWAVAVATAFIPVAHFLLVPGFGLFGVFVFFKRLRTRAVPTSVKGTCPDCGLAQSFDLGGEWQLPRTLNCTGCSRALKARSA